MIEPARASSSGPSFCALLLLLFIGLKLTGHIAWSWWWVFAPAWIPVALVVVGAAVGAWYEVHKEQKTRRSVRRVA